MRKKKKKRLKSRRERNKRKAILKMSHYNTGRPVPSSSTHLPSPTNQPRHSTPIAEEEKKIPSESGSLVSGLGEAPKNNGIPIFIQERLDERQKKKNDTDSVPTDEVIENLYISDTLGDF